MVEVKHMINDSEERKNRMIKNQGEDSHSSYLNSPDPVFITNKNGAIIDVNDIFCELIGCDKKEILGVPIQEMNFLTQNSRKQAMYRQIARLIGKETPSYNLDIQTNTEELSLDIDTIPFTKNKKLAGEISIVRRINRSLGIKENYKKSLKDETVVKPLAPRSDELLNVLEKAKEQSSHIRQLQTALENKELELDQHKKELNKITEKWKGKNSRSWSKNCNPQGT